MVFVASDVLRVGEGNSTEGGGGGTWGGGAGREWGLDLVFEGLHCS